MTKVCCAIAGNWSCGDNGEWSFDVDKGRLGRLVSISEKSTLAEVCGSVALAFGECNAKTSLSFFNTSFGNTDVGSKMPPFLIETDCGVRNFFKLLLDRSDRNLMVTFSKLDEGSSFKTPMNEQSKKCGRFLSTGGICGKSKMVVEKEMIIEDEESLYFGEEMEAAEECLRSKGKISKKDEQGEDMRTPLNVDKMKKSGGITSEDGFCSRGAKRKSCVENCTVSEEDEGFFSEVSAVFELLESKGKGTIGSEEQEKRFTLVDEDEVEVAEKLISNKGKGVRTSPSFNLMNDYDFAERTASEEFGVEGFQNEFGEPTVGVGKSHPAGREYESRTNSVFDDVIRVGPPEEWNGYPKVEKGCGSSNMKPMFCGRSSGNFSSGNLNRGAFVGNTSDKRVDVDMNDVVDEESDVEPLFDDLRFVRLETEEGDVDEADDELFVGKTFRNKLECQTALAIYGIKKMFYFKQTRSNRDYIVVNCADSSCRWRVSAYKLKECEYYSIKKAELEHTCSIETRSQYTKLANHRVIAAMYKPKFITKESGPRPMDLQQILLEELRVPSSYTKCWKAREAANAQNQGTEEESYLNLLQYLHMLKLANPGTVADVETEDDGLGGERFLYLFLSFGASIQGFKHVRRVIVLDGAHLGGKYQGVMLTASGQDANFQVFPLAFAVVDSENEASWTWFLRKVSRIIGDSPSLTIISDRARSLLKALKDVYPTSRHGACIVHLARNIVKEFKSKGLAQMAIKAACCHKIASFNLEFDKIVKQSVSCAKYLRDAGFKTWTRAYFIGDRYNLMTSNIAESLNNALKKGRNSPIIELLMYIQSLMTRWFSSRRKFAEGHGGYVTPEVDKVITKHMKYAKGSRVTLIEAWRYEVIGQFGERHNVDLKGRKCSCKIYDNLHIPCGHGILAAAALGVPYGQVCSPDLTTVAWRNTYQGVVQPHENPKDVEMPEDVRNREIMPPKTKRPSGRPKEKRIPSSGEISGSSNQKGSSNRCGRCGGVGHNKSTCKNPI